MPIELPYLASYKNVGKLFAKISTAKQPDAFTHGFLKDTLGLKSTTDRPLIPLLRLLGLIDAAGKPTPEYAALKNPERAPFAVGAAVRKAYEPLFAADENAHKLSAEQLKGLIAQVAGTDEGMTTKIAGTLNALLKVANFEPAPAAGAKQEEAVKEKESEEEPEREISKRALRRSFTTTFRSTYRQTLPKRLTCIFSMRCGGYSGDQGRQPGAFPAARPNR